MKTILRQHLSHSVNTLKYKNNTVLNKIGMTILRPKLMYLFNINRNLIVYRKLTLDDVANKYIRKQVFATLFLVN